jgi:hypothetical protein
MMALEVRDILTTEFARAGDADFTLALCEYSDSFRKLANVIQTKVKIFFSSVAEPHHLRFRLLPYCIAR